MSEPVEWTLDVVRELIRAAPVFVALVVVPIVLLNVINVGTAAALRMAIMGWLMVFPVVALAVWSVFDPPSYVPVVGKSDAEADSVAQHDNPVDRLRDRYARGELSDEEFERRLNRLLETEGLSAELDSLGSSLSPEYGDATDAALDTEVDRQ